MKNFNNIYYYMYLIVPIKFPISYGAIFLFTLLPIAKNKVIRLFYPYVFICSLVGMSFGSYFYFNIDKYIDFEKKYNDPLLVFYPKKNKRFYYRIHLFFILFFKLLIIFLWPLSFRINSLCISSIYIVFLYILNVIYFNYNNYYKIDDRN